MVRWRAQCFTTEIRTEDCRKAFNCDDDDGRWDLPQSIHDTVHLINYV
jgi:hypothetical protein